MPNAELKGKVAWVTGGGSGIGLAGALALAKEGVHVVISGRTAETNRKAEGELKAVGSAEAVLLDVGNQTSVRRVAEDILERHGKIDILVNSAGTNLGKRHLKTMSLEGWDEVVRINLSGLFYCCYAVLPSMRSRKDGLIINISSWAGRYVSQLTGPAYNATKRAVIALSETINCEECVNGIRATSILPAEVATPIMLKRPVVPSQAEQAKMLQSEDLGAAIRFVASLSARACVNELIISPTWNRFYLGGLE